MSGNNVRVQRLQLALQSLSRTQRGPWLFTKLLFEISDIKNVSVVTVLSLSSFLPRCPSVQSVHACDGALQG